jgi:ABC-type multidrug transport system, ATPase component
MKLNELSKAYGGRMVLHMPEFELLPGLIYAAVGSNGSGKSTLAKLLVGVVKADGGVPPFADKKPVIGYLPQKCYAFRLSLRKNLCLAGEDGPHADALLSALGLDALSGAKAKKLSGGETQKLCLARVLMRDTSLLILDEPTAALDVESTLAAEQLIDEYRQKTGAAVVLITHSPAQAARLADEVLFFYKGELTERGADILQNPRSTELKGYLNFWRD